MNNEISIFVDGLNDLFHKTGIWFEEVYLDKKGWIIFDYEYQRYNFYAD